MPRLPRLKPQSRFDELPEQFYKRVKPQPLNNPYLVAFSPVMAEMLGIEASAFEDPEFIEVLTGNRLLENSDPLAMLYAGHQFGHFVPQLGDGRALMLGDLRAADGSDWEIQLKGAGLTPFSRMGDGRAVLRSTIREFLCSEAMAALGIPSTRALCITGSADPVYRETTETSAVLTRAAPSHLRFGNFEVFFYRQQYAELKILADFIIAHYYPDSATAENPYLDLFDRVIERTASLVAKWQLVGFTHGVLNSDNMSILGLTIDYGPFGFLDTFESAFVCNHTDEQGRYAYDQQPRVGLFNLSCLAQAMLPLFDQDDGQNAAEMARASLQAYQPAYEDNYYQGMAAKLGLAGLREGDDRLFSSLFETMEGQVDFTNFFRGLCDFDESADKPPLRDQFIQREKFDDWCKAYRHRLAAESSSPEKRRDAMLACNPHYILRNYLAHKAIVSAQKGDFSEVVELHRVLQTPFDEQAGMSAYTEPPPDWARGLELSCSS